MIKKGTFVKFVGTDKLQSVKTYVYGLNLDKILIEHPQGTLSTEPDVQKHLFENYNLTLNKPQRFIEVSSTELIALNRDGSEMQIIEPQPEKASEFVDEMVMVQMPKSLLFYLRDSAIQQQKIVNGEMEGVPSMLRGPLKMMMKMMKSDGEQANEVHDQVIGALNESIAKMIPVKQLLDSVPEADVTNQISEKQTQENTQTTPQPEANV